MTNLGEEKGASHTRGKDNREPPKSERKIDRPWKKKESTSIWVPKLPRKGKSFFRDSILHGLKSAPALFKTRRNKKKDGRTCLQKDGATVSGRLDLEIRVLPVRGGKKSESWQEKERKPEKRTISLKTRKVRKVKKKGDSKDQLLRCQNA